MTGNVQDFGPLAYHLFKVGFGGNLAPEVDVALRLTKSFLDRSCFFDEVQSWNRLELGLNDAIAVCRLDQSHVWGRMQEVQVYTLSSCLLFWLFGLSHWHMIIQAFV